MLEGIKAVIFDLDGTVVDSMWMWEAIDIEYLARFGIPLPPDLQKKISGMSFRETAVYFKETFGIPDSLEKIKSDWNDMVLVDCANRVSDLDAYGEAIVLIWLYARPFENGAKNVAMMEELETRLNKVIEDNKNNGIYGINRRNTYSDYDPDRQWHCNIVELNILIG